MLVEVVPLPSDCVVDRPERPPAGVVDLDGTQYLQRDALGNFEVSALQVRGDPLRRQVGRWWCQSRVLFLGLAEKHDGHAAFLDDRMPLALRLWQVIVDRAVLGRAPADPTVPTVLLTEDRNRAFTVLPRLVHHPLGIAHCGGDLRTDSKVLI